MAVFQNIIAFYVADRADMRLRGDRAATDDDRDAALLAVKHAADAVAGSIPADQAEARAMLDFADELLRAEEWEDQAEAIMAQASGASCGEASGSALWPRPSP